jgi:hypothetical protein
MPCQSTANFQCTGPLCLSDRVLLRIRHQSMHAAAQKHASRTLTWQRMACQSSTSFCVHLSTMVEVYRGDASLAR